MVQMLKKISVILALFTLLTVSLGALESASVTSFSDVPSGFWGYKTIMDMTAKGIFKGTEEPVNGVGVFSPDKIMSRAEFITASLRAIFPDEAKNVEVPSAQWWRGYYTFALEKGILKAGELNNGELEKAMTREEMAMVMVRCVTQNGEKLSRRVSLSQIPDYLQIGDFYMDYVRDCFSFGLLCGVDENGTFAPTKSLTRAEAATVICRLLDKDMRIKVEFAKEPSGSSKPQVSDKDTTEKMPWENGGKQPSEYTMAEFEALTDAQKSAFIESFGNTESFNAWKNKAEDTDSAVELPWKNGGKQPSEYTMAEFEALTDAQKSAFIESFGSTEAFSAWMNKAENSDSAVELPWENGGKQPSEYTMAEFEALSDAQKSAFIESFGITEAFNAWMNKAEDTESAVELPWKNGGKQPSEYTLAEFEALTDTQKSAFVKSFGSTEAFNAWMNKAEDTESAVELPWENGGKKPSEYTLAEFEALTDAQKSAFVKSLGGSEAFDKWMSKAQDTEDSAEELPWENGGKKPSEYTLAEFGALTDTQKAAFVESFGSTEAFEKWLNSNNQ